MWPCISSCYITLRAGTGIAGLNVTMFTGNPSAPGISVGGMTPVQYVLPWTNNLTDMSGSVMSLPGTAQFMLTDNNNIKSNTTALESVSPIFINASFC